MGLGTTGDEPESISERLQSFQPKKNPVFGIFLLLLPLLAATIATMMNVLPNSFGIVEASPLPAPPIFESITHYPSICYLPPGLKDGIL